MAIKNSHEMETEVWINKLSQYIATILPSDKGQAWLYGSRARGNHRPDSDWDILILLDNETTFEQDYDTYGYPLVEFGWKHNLELNPVIFSKKRWKNHPNNLFHYNVDKDRIRL